MLAAQVEALHLDCGRAKEAHNNEYSRRLTAEKELNETRKQFADLKERLHIAELENARNEGYLQRVREDDNVADPLVEIESPEGKRMVSKRYPSNPVYATNTMGLEEYHYNHYNKEKPKHWVNY